jgi:glycosyltransferase involved in cell wall biosynthesis
MDQEENKETLSICIPTKNRADKLRNVVSTFIKQIASFDVKIYISDNSDDDKTEKLISREFFSDKDRVIYLKNEDKLKTYSTNILNLAYKANGRYVWFFSDDDLPFDNAIETFFSYIYKSPDFFFIKYVGYDKNLEKILPGWTIASEKDQMIHMESIMDALILSMSYTGFISFIVMRRKYLLKALESKYIDLSSNYIQTFAWLLALTSMPKTSFGIFIGKPLVKWREDYVDSHDKTRSQKSRFLLDLEHREIFSIISKLYGVPRLLSGFDGPFQIHLILKAKNWRSINHISLSDAISAIRKYDDLRISTKILFLLMGIAPISFIKWINKFLTSYRSPKHRVSDTI